jgi:transposase-like protein
MAYKSSAVDWANYIRDWFVEYYYRDIRSTKFSGIVEIDESLFGRRVKYNKGKAVGRRIWIFGMVERDSNRIKLFPVSQRDRDTLIPIIQENIEKGSTIYSDA